MKRLKRVLLVVVMITALFLNSITVLAVSGNTPPTSNTSLPYYTSKTRLNTYVYTAKRFKPNLQGYIFMCFYGVCESSTPATTITWKIEVNSTGSEKKKVSFSGSNFPFTPQTYVGGLDPNTYYHGVVTKNNTSSYMSIKCGYGKSQSEARNYSW